MTCCTGQGQSSHGALTLWKASTSGFQLGGQATDFVLLVMNPKGRARPAPDFGKDMRHPRRSTSQPSRWLRGIVEMTRRQSRHALRIALGIALATILLGLLAILAVEWMSSPSFLTTTICHRHARNCAPRWMPTEHRVHELERL